MLHALAFRDVARGTGNRFHPAVSGKHRQENVLVVAGLPRGPGKRGVVPQGSLDVNDLLYLALEALGELRRVTQVKEVFA